MEEFDKVAIMLGTLACQVQIVSMSVGDRYGFGNTSNSEGETVLAFTILALIFLLGAEILIVEFNFVGDLKGKGQKIGQIIALLCFWTAAACIIVSLCVWPSSVLSDIITTDSVVAYLYTTFSVAAAAAIMAGVFILLSVRGKK